MKFLLLVLLIVGYCGYFAYAMWYEFGDEGSIRLLWISCLVLVCITLHVIWKYYGDKIDEALAPVYKITDKHPLTIN